VTRVLEKTQVKPEIIGYVSPDPDYQEPYLGSVDQIEEITRIHHLDEILFCAANISSRRIISIMTRLTGLAVNYKIAPPESLSIIGSNSINTSGELYTIHFNSIGKAANLRSKRLFDLMASLLLILFFPCWALFVKYPLRAVSRLFSALVGKRTIVGYYTGAMLDTQALPALRKGILHPAVMLKENDADRETLERLNVIYAKDYHPATDFQILVRGFRQLGSHHQ
jgi:hypothetical protein